MGIKKKISEKTDPIKSKFGTVRRDTRDVKKILETKNVIYQKTDAIAILVRKRGEFEQFCKEFDLITKEGYELKARETLYDPIPKLNVTLGYLYIFQKKKYTN